MDLKSLSQWAYFSLDMSVMDSINTGVKVWNWTTGGDKISLAKSLNIASSASWAAGAYFLSPLVGIALGPLSFFSTYKTNTSIEYTNKTELLGKMSGNLSRQQEELLKKNRKENEVMGYSDCTFGLGLLYLGVESSSPVATALGASFCLSGLSKHTERTRVIPTRSNVFSRAYSALERKTDGGED